MEVREKKMVSMSQQIVELMESTQAQQDELRVLREAGQDTEEMREEFAKRIGMSEKKLQAVIKVSSQSRWSQLHLLSFFFVLVSM